MQNSIFMADFNRWRWGISPRNFRRVLRQTSLRKREPASTAGPFMHGNVRLFVLSPNVPHVFIWGNSELAAGALVRGIMKPILFSGK